MIKHLLQLNVSRFLLSSLFLLLGGLGTHAQQDTEFWFAAPEISSSEGDSPISITLLTYGLASDVTIDKPADGAFTPIVVSLAANDETTVDLTPFIASIESPAADVVSNTGLRITATENITAYYELGATGNKEIFSLKGTKALGTNFYTPFQDFWNNASTTPGTFNSIEIVATEDNTTVLITPRTDIVGHTVGSTYSVVLMEGETYSARDIDLTGSTTLDASIVSSDKPIAVTTFCGALSNSGCTSTMGDQITPTDVLGQDYIIHRGTASNERVYILATENSTSITVENSTTTSTLINWSETFEVPITDDINYITSNKPIYVWHTSGNGCNLAGAQVPGLFCAGKYEQAFSRSSTDSLGLIVYTRAGFEGLFEINGSSTLLTSGDFSVVPGTSGEFVVAQKFFNTTDIPVGSYNEITNSGDIFGLGVLHGQSGNGTSLAYLSEMISYPFIDAGPATATVCANVPFPVTGVIGGGSVTGEWDGTGFGTFSSSSTTLINVYNPSDLDTIISPIELILTSTGPCPVQKDTIILTVNPAPIVNAGADQTVCANNADVVLDGSVIGGSSTGEWETLGSGTFLPDEFALDATYVPSPADTVAGTVQLILTSTGAPLCNATKDTMEITITPQPVVDAGPPTLSVCENNADFSLSGTVFGGSTSGKWTTSGNGSFSPDNLSLDCDYTPSPLDISGGSITIYLTSTANGTCNAVKDSIVVTFTPGPDVDAGADILTCFNDPQIDLAGLVSGPTSTGQWSGGAGTFTPDDEDLNASYEPTAAEVSAGTVTLTLTSTMNGSCAAESDIVKINFIAPPFANYNFEEVCLGDTTIFTDFSLNGFGSIVSWDWDFDDGVTSTDQNPIHFYSDWGTYDVELIVESDAGCSDTLVQSVVVHELPTADFNWNATCEDDLVIISFTDNSSTPSEVIDYWFYDFGGQGSQATQNPSQNFIGFGDFVITQIVRTEFGCTDTTIKIVNVPPKPEAGFFYNAPNGLNTGAVFEFIDTSNYAVAWDWDFDNGETSTDQDPTTVYFENGTYVVTQYVTGTLGCEDSATAIITINTVTNEINDLIPNAISPNGDGKNDVWKLEFIEFTNPNAEVIVMNRWGQTVFESIGYADPWDGTINGELVPEGTYFYIIKISDEEVYKGTILVLITNDN
ncbi:MAG: PKD domain-containing protein [Crocinitomicaceae bacterium]|nr:PKD domain-containing protein [Crocinitomicaceae bacterium]